MRRGWAWYRTGGEVGTFQKKTLLREALMILAMLYLVEFAVLFYLNLR